SPGASVPEPEPAHVDSPLAARVEPVPPVPGQADVPPPAPVARTSHDVPAGQTSLPETTESPADDGGGQSPVAAGTTDPDEPLEPKAALETHEPDQPEQAAAAGSVQPEKRSWLS